MQFNAKEFAREKKKRVAYKPCPAKMLAVKVVIKISQKLNQPYNHQQAMQMRKNSAQTRELSTFISKNEKYIWNRKWPNKNRGQP